MKRTSPKRSYYLLTQFHSVWYCFAMSYYYEWHPLKYQAVRVGSKGVSQCLQNFTVECNITIVHNTLHKIAKKTTGRHFPRLPASESPIGWTSKVNEAERIRLPKLNNLMTIDYSYHIRAVDRLAALDLESNYPTISAGRTQAEYVMRDQREAKCKMLQLHFPVRKTAYTSKNN